jgi:hypothetical protein
MEEITLDLNNQESVGLGDNLCLLSALAHIPPTVNLRVDNTWNTFDRLSRYKRIFRIPDSQLKIVQVPRLSGTLNNVGWPVKLFSEYYMPTYINVNGQSLKVKDDNQKKKCIAIACSSDLNGPADQWPWCRSRPNEFWGRLIAWIKSLDYDVITVDMPYHDLENKIELMVKNCRAIISYEGGMAHLAHMLDMPCFILDWNLPSPSTTLDRFHCEFVHMSKSAYIVRNDNELFEWNRETFDSKIADLENGIGNNRLVNGSAIVNFQGPGCTGNISVVSPGGIELLSAPPIFGHYKVVTQLLNQYYPR